MFEYLPTGVVVYLYILFGVLGLVLGSALNCLALRLAAGQKWGGKERSACPACGHTLGALDLIPLVSWLMLGGKCRYCRTPVSKRYPLTEAGMAIMAVSLLWRFGLTPDLVSAGVLCACLLCLSLVDLDTQIIPDRFLVIPAVVRAIQLLMEGGLSGLLTGVVPGVAIGGGILILSLIMDKVLKKDTMGGGDIKLLAVLGMFFSFPVCLLLVLVACFIGIAMASLLMRVSPDTPFPFGPAISAAAWITLLAGEPLVAWYMSLF